MTVTVWGLTDIPQTHTWGVRDIIVNLIVFLRFVVVVAQPKFSCLKDY